jgi:hypothetical protein
MMVPLVLSLSLALAGSDGHASLHAADADFYLEVPDPSSLPALLATSAMARTVQEPAVKGFYEGLGVDPVASLRSLTTRIIPGQDITPLLAGLRAASLSLAYGDELHELTDFGFQAVLDFSSQEIAASVSADLLRLVGKEDPNATSADFQLANLPDVPLWCHLEGGRLAVGGGAITRASLDALGSDEAPSVATSEFYRAAEKQLGAGKGATVARIQQSRSPFETVMFLGFLIMRAVSGEDPPSMSELGMLPLPLRGASHMRMQYAEGRYVTEVLGGEIEGATKVLGRRAVEPAWLDPVPQGVMAFYSSSLDSAALTGLLRSALAGRAEISEELAGKLQSVLSRMGPGLVAYMFPVTGIGIPSTFFWLEIDGAEGFQEELDALLADLSTVVPGLKAKTSTYRPKNAKTGERESVPLTTLTLPPDMLQLGPMFTVSPSFAVMEDRLLVGVSSMSVKRELKRLYGRDDQAAGAEQHPMQASGCVLPEGARSVFWMDWGSLVEGSFSLVRALGTMMGAMGGGELPFDPSSLPAAEQFTQHMRPTFHTSQVVEGGLYRRHEASFGPETWLTIIAIGLDLGME